MSKVNRVLISVSDKTGITDFARGLSGLGAEIISTGGTARLLKENGVPVKLVSEVTNFPEMMDGRLKTLHPKIHGGVLALRSNPEHMQQIKEQGINLIDMVVVNLYPFRETISKPDVTLEEAIENIDIGGPTMVRAAAKNYQDVAIVVNPKKYDEILEELKNNGELSKETKERLALEAFEHTAEYDDMIHQYLQKQFDDDETGLPKSLSLRYKKMMNLRYGENPHQHAAFYAEPDQLGLSLAKTEQLHGKQISFNNINDVNSAVRTVREFERPTAVLLKHTNPCGIASNDNLAEAYRKAFATDTISPFGGIVGLNRNVDKETALEIKKLFLEVVIAPDYDEEALEVLKKKKNLRILKMPDLMSNGINGMEFKKTIGGLLVQDYDFDDIDSNDLKVVTEKKPTEEQIKSMLFARKVVKHTKSNAIVLVKGEETLGVGGGETSRVEAVQLAAKKAKDNKKTVEDVVLASDAFFPFRDGIDEAAKIGAKAIIQPGGSIRDQEAIDAANEHGIAMVFTGKRCFMH